MDRDGIRFCPGGTGYACRSGHCLSGNMQQWLGKPAKAERFKMWCENVQVACESLRRYTL